MFLNTLPTYRQFVAAAKQFGIDSRGWDELDPDVGFYTTRGASSAWMESGDCAEGGFDVSWAFHKTPTAIAKLSLRQFLAAVGEEITVLADNADGERQWLDAFSLRLKNVLNSVWKED